MNITAFHFLTRHDALFSEDVDPEDLTECIAPLSDGDRYALRWYWNQLVWDECVPPDERVERVPSFAELDERRAQRRMRRSPAATAESNGSWQDGKSGSGAA
jgi:hypothetical protein